MESNVSTLNIACSVLRTQSTMGLYGTLFVINYQRPTILWTEIAYMNFYLIISDKKRYLSLQHFIHQYQFMLNILSFMNALMNRQGICGIILITAFFLSTFFKMKVYIKRNHYLVLPWGRGWELGGRKSCFHQEEMTNCCREWKRNNKVKRIHQWEVFLSLL